MPRWPLCPGRAPQRPWVSRPFSHGAQARPGPLSRTPKLSRLESPGVAGPAQHSGRPASGPAQSSVLVGRRFARASLVLLSRNARRRLRPPGDVRVAYWQPVLTLGRRSNAKPSPILIADVPTQALEVRRPASSREQSRALRDGARQNGNRDPSCPDTCAAAPADQAEQGFETPRRAGARRNRLSHQVTLGSQKSATWTRDTARTGSS